MNHTQPVVDPAAGSALGLLLLIGLAIWCWFSSGPYFLRWPLLVLIILMTSGHWMGEVVGGYIGVFAAPLLTLFLMGLGIWIMLRGVFGGGPRRRYGNPHYRYGRWWDGRW